MKWAALIAAASLVLAGAGVAAAADYTVAPGDLAGGEAFDNGRGGEPFGYDPDTPPPKASPIAGPTGYETRCFWSDVQGSAAGDPDDRDYCSFRLSPRDIFGVDDVTLSELTKVAYWTKNLDTSKIDWQLKIYTESSVQWYKQRFNFVRPNAADNDWHKWDTDSYLRVSDIYDKEAGSYVAVPDDGELADLCAAYGSEKILFLDLIAGYATNSPPVDSLLDGVELTLSGATVKTMDLVPEPATAALLAAGGALALIRRRRR